MHTLKKMAASELSSCYSWRASGSSGGPNSMVAAQLAAWAPSQQENEYLATPNRKSHRGTAQGIWSDLNPIKPSWAWDGGTWCSRSAEICSCTVMGHVHRCARCTITNISHTNTRRTFAACRHFDAWTELRRHLSTCIKKHQLPQFMSRQPVTHSTPAAIIHLRQES